MRYRHISALLLMCLFASAIQAQSFARGDVLAHTFPSVIFGLYGPSADLTVLDAAGKHKAFFGGNSGNPYSFPVLIGGLYAAAPDRLLASAGSSVYVSPDARTATLLLKDISALKISALTDIIPMRSGDFLAIGGTYGWRRVVRFTSDGKVLSVVELPDSLSMDVRPAHAELFADQCTLLWSFEHGSTRVHAYDLCANEARPDFAVLPRNVSCIGAIRRLPNGDVLIATCDDVRRFDATGSEIAVYRVPGAVMALTPDASGFWAAEDEWPNLYRIDFGTPARIAVHTRLHQSIRALAVVGEWRASLQPPPRRRAVVRR